jgi:CheY-like chemotaxis protein
MKRILAADDDSFNRHFLKIVLDKDNYEIDFASNGSECIEMLANDTSYSMVIMDLETPVMTGWEACRYIRTKLPAPVCGIPIAAITGHTPYEAMKLIEGAGFSKLLCRPVSKKQLLDAIMELTQQQKAEPVYSLEILDEWASGNQETIRELIKVFIRDTPPKLLKIQNAFEQKDWKSLKDVAHNIAPQMTMIGLNKGYKAAAFLEKTSGEAKLDEMGRNINVLISNCQAAINKLKIDYSIN